MLTNIILKPLLKLLSPRRYKVDRIQIGDSWNV